MSQFVNRIIIMIIKRVGKPAVIDPDCDGAPNVPDNQLVETYIKWAA